VPYILIYQTLGQVHAAQEYARGTVAPSCGNAGYRQMAPPFQTQPCRNTKPSIFSSKWGLATRSHRRGLGFTELTIYLSFIFMSADFFWSQLSKIVFPLALLTSTDSPIVCQSQRGKNKRLAGPYGPSLVSSRQLWGWRLIHRLASPSICATPKPSHEVSFLHNPQCQAIVW